MDIEILALAVSILIVVVLVRARVDLGLAMMISAASLALIVLRPFGWGSIGWTAVELGRAAIEVDTLLLLGRIIMIITLGALAGRLGYLDRFVSGLRKLIPDNRVVIALMPAFGGLLPMPGGAMLSAPMVESALQTSPDTSGAAATPEEKFFVNYWFRHVWEYVWPLYPGLVVVASLVNRSLRDLFLANYPLTIAAIAGGTFFVLRRVRAGRNERRGEGRRAARRDLITGILPFAVTIVGVLVLKFELILVVLAVVALLAVVEHAKKADILVAFRRGAEFQIVTLVIGVAAYKHMLTAAGIIDAVPTFFMEMHLPQLAVIAAVPMLIGLITGVTLAFIGVTFPLLLPLMGGADIDLTLVMFAFASGFVGCLLSPVHLCLVLSREYFRADLGRSYRMLILPSLTVMGVATALVLL